MPVKLNKAGCLTMGEPSLRAMLVRPTRAAGGIDLLTVSLDAIAWTRLITGGLEQQTIALPALAHEEL